MTKISSGRLTAAASLSILVYGVVAAMLGTLLPGLSARFQLTPEQSGYMALAQALGLIVASIAIGPLVDNHGKKTGILIALALIVVALAGLPGSAGYGQLLAFLFVLGLGGGALVTAAMALVSDIQPTRRAPALNLLTFFFGLGGLLTPFVAANVFGGNAVALCYTAAVLSATALLVNAATAMPPPSGERGVVLSETGALLGRPALYLLSLFLFLYTACEVGVWNWFAKHLVARGLPATQALNTLSLGFALGLMLGRVAAARLLTRVSAPKVTLAASALMAVTTYAALESRGPVGAWAAIFAAGLAMAPVFPTTLAMVGDAFPKATGTAMGIVTTSGWIGLAVSSSIIGSIAGGDDRRLHLALLVLPGCSLAMVLVNLALLGSGSRRTRNGASK